MKSTRKYNLQRTRDISGRVAISVMFYVLCLHCSGSVHGLCTISNCKDAVSVNDTCNCTQCNNGFYRANAISCFNCFFDCRTCENSYCLSCDYSDCNEYMYSTCSSQGCSQNTLISCPSCPDGYYWDRGRCYRCWKTGCKCSEANNCIGCLPGRYGSTCSEICPADCKTCYSSSYCTECIHGKNGETCKNSECDMTSDSCCKGTYIHVIDNATNAYECRLCPENCVTCKYPTYCTSCKQDRWGQYCQHNCTRCSRSCNNQGCITCTSGYYRNKTLDGYECIKCIDHCKKCFNDTTCNECNNGYMVDDGKCYQNNVPVNCPDSCKDGNCDQNGAFCIDGCIDGWSGKKCNLQCSPGCLKCEQLNVSSCVKCKNGFYGESCQYNCSSHCIYENEQSSCDKNSGTCDFGCADGYWGISCTESCGNGCNGLMCNKTTGECLRGCNMSYYGLSCAQECSKTCLQKYPTSRQCNKMSGECLYGCTTGYYGSYCSIECSSDCGAQQCLQLNGACITDSAADGNGTNSTIASENRATQPSTLTEESNIAVPVGAGAAGVVVIIVVVFFLLLFMRRRRTKRKPPASKEPLENANGTMGHDGNVYATICDSDDELPDVHILNEKSEDLAEKASPYHTENIETSDKNNISDRETRTALTTIIPKSMENSEISDSEKALSPSVQTGSQTVNAVLVSKEKREDVEPSNGECTSDKSYYNTLGKRVPVSKLSDYVKSQVHAELVEEFYKLPRGLQKDHNAAKSSRNASKNRYKSIYPYDESRVILKDGGNDYINASYIKGYNKEHEYIASSGPFKRDTTNAETVSDFWRMVWQEKCETILMLTNCWENTEHKCEQYWPELGSSNTYANISVTSVTEDTYADFTIRSFVVTKDDETLNVRQLHFTAWPDKGVPADVTSMIEYRQKVRSLHKDETCPLLVHCSAGIGRTGTFIALDLLTFKGEALGYVDVFGCLTDLRSQRVSLVQTPEQYKYLHHALLHSLTFDCQSITAEKFIETYSKLIKKKNGKREIESQFQTLQSNLESLSADDKTARDRNRALTDVNREGADIPGMKQIPNWSCLLPGPFEKLVKEIQLMRLFIQNLFSHPGKQTRSTIVVPFVKFADTPILYMVLAYTSKEISLKRKSRGDENRVRLFENRNPDASDYINAGFRSRNRFIVAQTPLPTTVVDLLSLIFQVKCSCVVAMEETNLQDQVVGVYWPADNQVIKHGVFQVRCKESRTTPNYTLKSLLLTRRLGKKEEKHEFDLFIFTNWPCTAAVPTSSDSLLQLVKDVDTRNHHPDEESSILVHCMTGAERSCLYCAVSVLIEKMEIEHEVSVVNTLRQIKARRHSAILTLAQYKFCHQAVISFLQTFDIYSNFGLKSTESMESQNE